MKVRGIVIIDYNFKDGGGFISAAEEQKKLEEAVSELVKGNNSVASYAVDMRERRGDRPLDISKLKVTAI